MHPLYVDTALPFDLRSAPKIFTMVLDDFLAESQPRSAHRSQRALP